MKEIAAVLITILIAASSPARIITVDDDGPADFTTIQAAINDANDGDTIEIQPGTYTGPGNRDIDFLGKAITVTSTDPNDPNTVAQTTITGDAFVFQSGEDANSVLDGLTITGGSPGVTITDSAPTITNCTMTQNYERAIYCQGATGLRIANCLFTANAADIGGAIYFDETTAILINCIFRSNFTEGRLGRSGGAIRAYDSTLTFTHCTFQDNHAESGGGAMNAHDCQLVFAGCLFEGCSAPNAAALCFSETYGSGSRLTDCLFVGNFNCYTSYEGHYGGTIWTAHGTMVLTNCVFAGNRALERAGALYPNGTDLTVANCTFANNYAPEGNTLFADNRLVGGYSNIRMENNIMWEGPDSIVVADETTLLVTFSDIQGFVPGYGNIDADPCFAAPGRWVDSRDPNIVVEPNHQYAAWVNGDYHLESQAGRYDPNTQSWVQDDVTSPCIDAGDPNTPIGYEPFPNGGRINMGAYGGTIEASKSYFGKPPCETIVAGDINGDCVVNGLDFSLMAAHWLGLHRKTYPTPATDPYPTNEQSDVSTSTQVRWTSGSNAVSHDVYFGTDCTGVGYADRDSPEYKGNRAGTTFNPGPLSLATTYYWRIDEIGPNGETTTGQIWQFTTYSRPPR